MVKDELLQEKTDEKKHKESENEERHDGRLDNEHEKHDRANDRHDEKQDDRRNRDGSRQAWGGSGYSAYRGSWGSGMRGERSLPRGSRGGQSGRHQVSRTRNNQDWGRYDSGVSNEDISASSESIKEDRRSEKR